MKKFKTGSYHDQKIEEIEIERETGTSIWIDGRRLNKRSGYENYFDTWDDAHAFLLKNATLALDRARLRLQQAQGEHGNIKGVKRPT